MPAIAYGWKGLSGSGAMETPMVIGTITDQVSASSMPPRASSNLKFVVVYQNDAEASKYSGLPTMRRKWKSSPSACDSSVTSSLTE